MSKIRKKTPDELQTQLPGVKKTNKSKLLGNRRKKYATTDARSGIIDGTWSSNQWHNTYFTTRIPFMLVQRLDVPYDMRQGDGGPFSNTVSAILVSSSN